MLEYIHALELRTADAEATVARKNAQVGIVPSHQLSLVVESILESFIQLTIPNFHHTPDLRFLRSPFVHTDHMPQEPAEIARKFIEPGGIGHTERVQQNLIGLRATLHEPRYSALGLWQQMLWQTGKKRIHCHVERILSSNRSHGRQKHQHF